VKALEPYLPRAEPLRAGDAAEALEPVVLDAPEVRHVEEDDDDVDMIPLIDISLVLLIFFMMTASISSGMFTPIETPSARHHLSSAAEDMYWIGIDVKSRAGKQELDGAGQPLPWFSLGRGSVEKIAPTRDGDALLKVLGEELDAARGEARVRLRAAKTLAVETVLAVTADVQDLEARLNQSRTSPTERLKIIVFGEVSEGKTP
jgi:biopolymer transport protein ExbD